LGNVNLSFLDNVDIDFALRLREQERLAGFRDHLRVAWDKIENKADEAIAAREFTDRLIQAKNEAEGEWMEINADILKWGGPALGAVVTTGATAAVAAGALGPAVSLGLYAAMAPGIGFLAAAVGIYLADRSKRCGFRKKRPMSVLLDLSQHKSS
jgi:hypothetical protein